MKWSAWPSGPDLSTRGKFTRLVCLIFVPRFHVERMDVHDHLSIMQCDLYTVFGSQDLSKQEFIRSGYGIPTSY